ncbi:pentapeptide repeat-containing protein [Hyphomicrobium sp. DMF-1]|uniref:pentapeptide repeat-containing protein n=1 Tax=Hyphomicrobium sp. DMF-1 TaxID=3019544 RepID=UPI0022EBE524|nr:pentapeptide repeat-containing protein [Hyphomicrobium sp. DMF-1]WBT40133.1 pentapeptide repeat-containing protein [Hyphomicrobium sp. DMF-1]
MKFQIKSRWDSSKVIFETEIECSADTYEGVKRGLAIRAAIKSGAVLSGADLSGADLRDAVLRDADLRDAVLRDADLRGADLRGAVLSDAVLRDADLRGAVLRDAVLRDAVLRGADLRGAVLSDADLRDADLRGAVLSDAVLRDADLRGAVLRDAVLRGAVLRGADLSDCPVKIANIHQKVYAAASLPNALDMGSWHATDSCGTTHCRAGWVIHLAGDGGRALEYVMGTPAAAAVIYMASDPTLEKVPAFYCGNDDALEDMKRLAEAEATAVEATP